VELSIELTKMRGLTSASLRRNRGIGGTTVSTRSGYEAQREISFRLTRSNMYHRLDDYQRNLYQEPEKMLMLAVLADAISCFQAFSSVEGMQRKKQFIEVRNWLWSNRNDWPFSYRNVCEALGLSPDYLRRGLLCRMKIPPSHTRRRELTDLRYRKAYHRGY